MSYDTNMLQVSVLTCVSHSYRMTPVSNDVTYDFLCMLCAESSHLQVMHELVPPPAPRSQKYHIKACQRRRSTKQGPSGQGWNDDGLSFW